ncbi:hypothetical protein [Mycolicibacterium pallens]|uniref:PE-PGRS family protein n=1 Tax=Mycolicibacterium pallens TaxID=370524 RepID=A0ABX8VK92_9MYCO|nr:hypothetical protein [Mycolicibacterium pallens]APE16320.1 hypothetical protein BOH72_14940 [Mycobacterium sp. WY10]QYL18227.1 hypothetical protein K0O64_06780 [Mycolicibacterium pallens]
MEFAAPSRPVRTAAALTTIGALALTPIALAPPALHAPGVTATRISTQAVHLTDAWSDLLNGTVASVVELGGLFVGANSTFPLPNPIFIAPVIAQLVLNPLIYGVQLITGQGGAIPGEIAQHLSNVASFASLLVSEIPPVIVKQIQTPFVAARDAIEFVANASNKLTALIEAPALFLNAALNSQYGLIGVNGPIAVPIILRNLLASAISTPLPTITLPFKKPAATVTPKLTAAVSDPADTASSARSKTKAPSANSKRKATTAKSGTKPAGARHGTR